MKRKRGHGLDRDLESLQRLSAKLGSVWRKLDESNA